MKYAYYNHNNKKNILAKLKKNILDQRCSEWFVWH